MKLLDLFCGAGGAGEGYRRAGFEVTGVDIKPQPCYKPGRFIQGDALEYAAAHGHEYDVIHASPPCQAYTQMQKIRKNSHAHPDLVAPTREVLIALGKPYIIENVVGSPVRPDFVLCGTMFGLPLIRHRWFELSWPCFQLLYPCNHTDVFDPWHGKGRTAEKFRKAFGIDWMPRGGGGHNSGTIDEAIPPAYTEWIGRQIMKHLAQEYQPCNQSQR